MMLKDRIVLVTGGAKRIGFTIALALAKRGARIVISYRSSRKDAYLALDALKPYCRGAMAIKADISQDREVKNLMDQIKRKCARLDVLVNSAASFERTPFSALSQRKWDDTININLRGSFLCA